MSDRTPDLEELRTTYGWASSVSERYPRMEAFDRAIAKIKADTLREAAKHFDGRASMLIEGVVRNASDENATRWGAYAAEAENAAAVLRTKADRLDPS